MNAFAKIDRTRGHFTASGRAFALIPATSAVLSAATPVACTKAPSTSEQSSTFDTLPPPLQTTHDFGTMSTDAPSGKKPDVHLVPFVNRGINDILLADINGDGKQDALVVQCDSLTVIDDIAGNARAVWRAEIATKSTSPACPGFVRAAWADLNRDGVLDVVATTSGPIDDTHVLASVVGYVSHLGQLPQKPTFALGHEAAGALALGDLNGDGWIDISCAGFRASAGPGTPFLQAIYWNDQGDFDGNKTPPWLGAVPATASAAATHLVADLNNDGLLDLVTAGFGPTWGHVFFAEQSATGITLQREGTALASLSNTKGVVAWLSNLTRTSDGQASLLVSMSNEPIRGGGAFVTRYVPSQRTYPWQSSELSTGTTAHFVPDAQGKALDIVVGQIEFPKGNARAGATPACIVGNVAGASTSGPQCLGQATFAAQHLAVADLVGRPTLAQSERFTANRSGRWFATLAHPLISQIRSVRVDGKEILPNITLVPGSNWIGVNDVQANSTIDVDYCIPSAVDLIVADLSRPEGIPIVFSEAAKASSAAQNIDSTERAATHCTFVPHDSNQRRRL